jgi:hypothetical protein
MGLVAPQGILIATKRKEDINCWEFLISEQPFLISPLRDCSDLTTHAFSAFLKGKIETYRRKMWRK